MTTTAEQKKRGAFIVLEGLDRSGKTTQVKLLADRITEQGNVVKLMRFPGDFYTSHIGSKVRGRE